MDYLSLEKISKENKKKICIFGVGKIGRTWAYDILTCASFEVDCYCDNTLPTGKEIRDGIKTIDFDALCKNKENYLVFIAVNEKLQNEIKRQFDEEGIADYIMMGFLFLQEFCESVLDSKDEVVWERYKIIVDDELFIKQQFVKLMGYEMDLENPKTFNEKLQWLKLHDRNPKYTELVDKYEFKKYLRKTVGEEFVVPTLGVWNTVEEIEWDMLPNRFVLKCTHDSGSVVVCKDKNEIDVECVKKQLDTSMKCNFYWQGREWPYKNVRPRIIAEEYLHAEEKNEKEELGFPKDYKVFCFNGKPQFIMTIEGGHFDESKVVRRVYSSNWEKQKVGLHGKANEKSVEKSPELLDKMMYVADKLCKGMKHVRIDFYIIGNRLYVGEMTFYHMSGLERFDSKEVDVSWGAYLNLYA